MEEKKTQLSISVKDSVVKEFKDIADKKNISQPKMFEILMENFLSKSQSVLSVISSELKSLERTMSNSSENLIENLLEGFQTIQVRAIQEQFKMFENFEERRASEADLFLLQIFTRIDLSEEEKQNIHLYKKADLIMKKNKLMYIVKEINDDELILQLFPRTKNFKTEIFDLRNDYQDIAFLFRV